MKSIFTNLSCKALAGATLAIAISFSLSSCKRGDGSKSSAVEIKKYLKEWTVSNNCGGITLNYKMTITQDASNPERLKIKNFTNEGETLDGLIDEDNGNLTIPQQEYLSANTAISAIVRYESSTKLIYISTDFKEGGSIVGQCTGSGY